jgi:tetratricopeptide (TPR) repeat protein
MRYLSRLKTLEEIEQVLREIGDIIYTCNDVNLQYAFLYILFSITRKEDDLIKKYVDLYQKNLQPLKEKELIQDVKNWGLRLAEKDNFGVKEYEESLNLVENFRKVYAQSIPLELALSFLLIYGLGRDQKALNYAHFVLKQQFPNHDIQAEFIHFLLTNIHDSNSVQMKNARRCFISCQFVPIEYHMKGRHFLAIHPTNYANLQRAEKDLITAKNLNILFDRKSDNSLWTDLGCVKLKLGKLQESELYYTHAFATKKSSIHIHTVHYANMGVVKFLLGQLQDAEIYFSYVCNDPHFTLTLDLLLWIGDVKYGLNKFNEAQYFYTRAVQNPNLTSQKKAEIEAKLRKTQHQNS